MGLDTKSGLLIGKYFRNDRFNGKIYLKQAYYSNLIVI
jgi:hypothetical protein